MHQKINVDLEQNRQSLVRNRQILVLNVFRRYRSVWPDVVLMEHRTLSIGQF